MSDDKDITLPSYERAATIHPESHGHWDRAQISDLLHERDALRAENERLRILLARYGKHDYVCSSEHGRFPKRCDCWLASALAAKEKP